MKVPFERWLGAALIAFALVLLGSADASAQSKRAEKQKPEPAEQAAAPANVGQIWESTAAPAEKAAAPPSIVRGSKEPPPAVMDRGMLVDLDGFTLYTFDGDRRPNVSTCFGICETLWPPHVAPAGAKPTGRFTIVFRRDSSRHWAYDGKPLYRWARDKKPGDVTGDKINNVWHLIPDPGAGDKPTGER
jgi:predicted lipoprotein with Yx(FWY)xxD motif